MTETADSAGKPRGELAIQTVPMPKDTNGNGDIFGGWLLSWMDIAAGILTRKVTQGRVATVAIEKVSFILPVRVGCTVSCYARVAKVGRTSVQIPVEVWISVPSAPEPARKAAEGLFVFVAIDEAGKPRPINQ